MTRRTSLQYHYSPGLVGTTTTNSANSANSGVGNGGHAQAQQPQTIHDLACGYLLEFPQDFKQLYRQRKLSQIGENYFKPASNLRSHRLSHPHLSFIATPLTNMTNNNASPPSLPSRRYLPNGGHRNSQPSLMFYGQSDEQIQHSLNNALNLKHVPSQPVLFGKQFSPKSSTIIEPQNRHFNGGGGPTTTTSQNRHHHHYYQQHHSPSTPPNSNSNIFTQSTNSKNNSPSGGRKLPRASEKRILQRHPQSDLAFRFQRHVDYYSSNENNHGHQIRNEEPDFVDPVYLALKQATGRYGGGGSSSSRRGSSAHNFDSASPSPRNLSQVSLQDSGYAEISNSRNQLLGSTPMLDQPGMPPAKAMSNGIIQQQRRRAPKLNKQMKSLSLDCAEMSPPVCSTMRSPFKSKPLRQAQGFATSGETSDWERSVSPVGPSPRRLPPQPTSVTTHIVTHEYCGNDFILFLGDRMNIVDNGDPDWLHGIKVGDRAKTLLTFPNTCVAPLNPGEQPMKLSQNVNLIESRLRLYRDQVVFALPNSMRHDRVKVRNERGTIAECPLMYLMLL